jgi:hypothetical protein
MRELPQGACSSKHGSRARCRATQAADRARGRPRRRRGSGQGGARRAADPRERAPKTSRRRRDDDSTAARPAGPARAARHSQRHWEKPRRKMTTDQSRTNETMGPFNGGNKKDHRPVKDQRDRGAFAQSGLQAASIERRLTKMDNNAAAPVPRVQAARVLLLCRAAAWPHVRCEAASRGRDDRAPRCCACLCTAPHDRRGSVQKEPRRRRRCPLVARVLRALWQRACPAPPW